MNEKYVTSIDVSRKLKEAGVGQVGEFRWVFDNLCELYVIRHISEVNFLSDKALVGFTVSELLERLSDDELIAYAQEFCIDEDGEDDTYKYNDLFRSPNKLAEVLLWKIGKEGK